MKFASKIRGVVILLFSCGCLLVAGLNESFEGTEFSGEVFGAPIKISVDNSSASDGKHCLLVSYPPAGSFSGVRFPPVELNQGQAEAIYLEGWAKLDNPSNKPKHYSFSISADVVFMDGSKKWVNAGEMKTIFDPIRVDWQQVVSLWYPDKPVKSVRLKFMFNGGGNVRIDQLRVLSLEEAKGLKLRAVATAISAPETTATPATVTPSEK